MVRQRGRLPLLLLALVFAPAVGAGAPSDQKKDDKRQQQKLDQAQRQEVQSLVKLVDAAMTGQTAPSDIRVTWTNDFLKALEGKTYVPFTLTLDGAPPGAYAMYVRVVQRGSAPISQPGKNDDEKNEKGGATAYPFDDVHFLDLKATAGQAMRLSRAFAVAPGDYEAYVALKERGPAAAATALKTTVVKHALTIPDFWTNELATSTVILADRVEPLKEPVAKEQQIEHPYALGMTEIVPAADSAFRKNEELSVIFLVYNPSIGVDKKPDLTIEYTFHHKTAEGEKYFNKTEPQKFNEQTLPPAFDITAGHQLVAGQSVPLASFPDGDFRLEIKIADNKSGAALTRNVTFSVVGS